MSFIKGVDVSQYQKAINWPAVKADGVQIAIIKMTGGDAGLCTDSWANTNYYGAKAAGLALGGYHFGGGGNPENEADFFVAAMSPLEKDDVLVLDCEAGLANRADVVEWCRRFVQRCHDRTGIWPLLYASGSVINAHDWSPVLNNCGLWVAWYGRDPEGNLPVNRGYVMHQYTSSGRVDGVAGNVDMDAWFGTLAQFKKYGYQSAAPTPAPQPTPTPVPPPEPVPTPLPTPVPPVDPIPPPVPVSDIDKENNSLLKQILALLKNLVDKVTSIFK